MKIVYAYRYGIVGGVSTQLLLRQEALSKAGVEVSLYFSQDNGLRQFLANDSSATFGADVTFRSFVARERPDAVIVIDSPELLGQAPRKSRRGHRIYLDVHTTTQLGLAYLSDLSTRQLDGVLAPSQYSTGLIHARLPGVDVTVLPNILNAEVFRPPNCPDEGDGSREFVWVGKLDSHKNWRLALVYACMLKELFGRIMMTVVGGFTASDERARELFGLAHKLGIESEVKWIDRIENVALANIYRKCAATRGGMLVTSRDESFGMAAAEALLCGCPLIANNIPVFSEVLPPSPLVQLVDVWHPQEVADAARRLSNTDTQTCVDDVRRELIRRFGPEPFVNRFLGLLDT
jgi:glycosyltransferase involved in cell wall biosynthesis